MAQKIGKIDLNSKEFLDGISKSVKQENKETFDAWIKSLKKDAVELHDISSLFSGEKGQELRQEQIILPKEIFMQMTDKLGKIGTYELIKEIKHDLDQAQSKEMLLKILKQNIVDIEAMTIRSHIGTNTFKIDLYD